MTVHDVKTAGAASPLLTKANADLPALAATGPAAIAVRAGTTFAGRTFAEAAPLVIDVPLVAGTDYAVVVRDGGLGYLQALPSVLSDATVLGGFHFAPGGNAVARAGGDETPVINPCSLWDLNFRPNCMDPRGMALVDKPGGRFWCDIYLLGNNHLADGTSKFGATIADGDDPPARPDSGRFRKLDYDTAVAVMAAHGKELLSLDEFFAAAFGVTERTACGGEPRLTGLDAPRTSKWGVMQATGNMWVWGHDGDPDVPRASLFGGCWLGGVRAGSRCADVAYVWPGNSGDFLGARGRGDHLQLA